MNTSVWCAVIALGILTVSTERSYAFSNFGIVEPFPKNIYPIEFSSAQVTCVAFDSSGIKTPEKIEFMRKDMFAQYTHVTANDNFYFTKRTEEVIGKDGKKLKKLFVTLHIRNVTKDVDSQFGQLGRWECHAFAVGSPLERKHGFSINVIRRSEIPSVSVTKARILQRGDNTQIFCNVTNNSWFSRLMRISWYKDGVIKQSVRNPNPGNPAETLTPLVIRNAELKDGGNYTCLLEVLVKYFKAINVTDSTVIRIAPLFEKPKEDIELKKFKGESVSFECAVKGFPLQVEWKFQKYGEENKRSCISGSDAKYRIHRSGVYSPYILTVHDLQYTDRGSYYCCLPSNCSNNVNNNKCQRFELGVRDDSLRCKLDFGLLIDLTETILSPVKGKGARLVVTATGPKVSSSKHRKGLRRLRAIPDDPAYQTSNYTELNDLFDDLAKVICHPVDGGFSKWTPFSACSVTCGNGVKIRTRTCTNPPRQWKGKDCVGPREESMACNEGPCK